MTRPNNGHVDESIETDPEANSLWDGLSPENKAKLLAIAEEILGEKRQPEADPATERSKE